MKCTLCGETSHGLCGGKDPSGLVQISVDRAREILRDEYHLLSDYIDKRFADLCDASVLLHCVSCGHIFIPPSDKPRLIAFPGELGEWADREDAVGTLDEVGLKKWYEWWDKLEAKDRSKLS